MSPGGGHSRMLALYSGAGNDFLILDQRHEPELVDASTEAKALCRRGVSIGADGLVLLSFSDVDEETGAIARMRLWNADGSGAQFSGNAARCVIRYLVDEHLAQGTVRLQTDIGVVTGEVQDRTVKVSVPGIARVYGQRRIRVQGRDLFGTYAQVGVPFFVLLHDDPDDLPVRYLGRAIRNHSDLQPAGANVAFVRVDDEQGLYFRVYERGVETETLSSGTGSIAAALAAAVAGLVSSPVACHAKGGTLTVRFRPLTPQPAAATELGPAVDAANETAASANKTAASGPDVAAEQKAEPASAPEPKLAHGEPALFGDVEIEGETRRLLTGTACADALRLT